jgi:hypothetical protein
MFKKISNFFKASKELSKKLVLFETMAGAIPSEKPYYNSIKDWNGAKVSIHDSELYLLLPNKKTMNIKLSFYERDSSMIIRRGLLNGNFPIRVITVENSFETITIGSFEKNGFAVLFNILDISQSSKDFTRNIENENHYRSFFEDKLSIINQKKGRVVISEFEELVINYICLEILCLRRIGQYDAKFEIKITTDITSVAKSMVSEYNESHVEIAKMQVPMNCNWDGMWEHLRKYFKNNFNANIF